MPHYEGDLRAAEGARFAIIASRWNPRITDALVAGARKTFADNGVADAAVDVLRVPGAWELPMAAARLAAARRHVAIDHALPVCNGVLAVDVHDDAAKRAGGSHGNKGEEAALVAIEMAQLLERLP